MKANIDTIIKKANERIARHNWKVFPNDIKLYGQYVRLFFQSKLIVDSGVAEEDDDDMIYGIGIFLVNLTTHEFHDVWSIEEIDEVARSLNANESQD